MTRRIWIWMCLGTLAWTGCGRSVETVTVAMSGVEIRDTAPDLSGWPQWRGPAVDGLAEPQALPKRTCDSRSSCRTRPVTLAPQTATIRSRLRRPAPTAG